MERRLFMALALLLALATSLSGQALAGPDWVASPPLPVSGSLEVNALVFGDDRFMQIRDRYNEAGVTGFASTSTDGLSWTEAAFPSPWLPQQLLFDGTRFVAVACGRRS